MLPAPLRQTCGSESGRAEADARKRTRGSGRAEADAWKWTRAKGRAEADARKWTRGSGSGGRGAKIRRFLIPVLHCFFLPVLIMAVDRFPNVDLTLLRQHAYLLI